MRLAIEIGELVIDINAIETRHRAAVAVGRKLQHRSLEPGDFSILFASSSDVSTLVDHIRATEQLQAEIDRMKPVLTAAEAYVDRHGPFLRSIRNEEGVIGEGDAPRFALIDAMETYRQSFPTDGTVTDYPSHTDYLA